MKVLLDHDISLGYLSTTCTFRVVHTLNQILNKLFKGVGTRVFQVFIIGSKALNLTIFETLCTENILFLAVLTRTEYAIVLL